MWLSILLLLLRRSLLLPRKAGLCPSGLWPGVHHKGTKAQSRKAFTTDARRSQAIVFVNHKPITIRITATTREITIGGG